MSCEAIRDRYHDLLDGELGPEEERELRAHLDACPACREAFEELAAVVGVVREIPAPETPAELAGDVLARIPRKGRRRESRFGRMLWLAPIAAAAGLLVIATLAPPRRPAPGTEPGVTKTARSNDVGPEPSPSADRLKTEKGDTDAEEAGAPPATNPRPTDALEERLGAARTRTEEKSGAAGEAESGGGFVAKAAPAPPAGPGAQPAPGRGGAPGTTVPSGAKAPAEAKKDAEPGAAAATEEIHVRGEDPDTVAGVLLAELGNFRARAPAEWGEADRADAAKSGRECGEEVRSDREGEIRSLVLCVTPDELRFLRTLLRHRTGRRAAISVGGGAGAPFEPGNSAPAAEAPPADPGARDAGAADDGPVARGDASEPETRRRLVIRFD